MSYQKKRFYYECSEAEFIKLQSLSGKSFFQNTDFQRIITNLIGKIYDTSNGKKFSY
jgi:hypothetical protein